QQQQQQQQQHLQQHFQQQPRLAQVAQASRMEGSTHHTSQQEKYANSNYAPSVTKENNKQMKHHGEWNQSNVVDTPSMFNQIQKEQHVMHLQKFYPLPNQQGYPSNMVFSQNTAQTVTPVLDYILSFQTYLCHFVTWYTIVLYILFLYSYKKCSFSNANT
ncbi:hypothetical protein RFI_34282, partial [Reticulomyxa filosa]